MSVTIMTSVSAKVVVVFSLFLCAGLANGKYIQVRQSGYGVNEVKKQVKK